MKLSAFNSGPMITVLIGLALTLFLFARGYRAALLLGIIGTTILAGVVHALVPQYAVSAAPGTYAVIPPQLLSLPDFSNALRGLNFESFVILGLLGAVLAIFTIMLSDFFDTMGTAVALGDEAGLLDGNGKLPDMNRVLLVDSLAAAAGGAASATVIAVDAINRPSHRPTSLGESALPRYRAPIRAIRRR